MILDNVLVAVDLSDVSANLIEQAKKVADKKDSKIWLIHVAATNPDFVGLEVGPQYIRDNVAEELKEDHREIQEFAEALRMAGYNAEGLMIQGPEADVLLNEMDRLKADMMIIGSHGHSSLYDLFVGSVCKEVLKKANRPVMVVPTEVS
jgi:nucleotide-binding universal stress UspA family protein